MYANHHKVIVFDTTMRDGELMPGVKMNLSEKIEISQLLEEMKVDIIEVGYPGNSQKDFQEVFQIAQIVENTTICGLASFKADEIVAVGEAIKPAKKGRIHTYHNVNIRNNNQEELLASIQQSISLARNYCDDVEWTAFDAPRSEADFLCKAIETAIDSGATTINIPDSLGLASPLEFQQLLQMIFPKVPNIEQVIVSVHCHDDLGKAVENSLVALDCGVRQIECAINGLGARKGNADLEEVVIEILKKQNYQVEIDTSLIKKASKLVGEITGIKK